MHLQGDFIFNSAQTSTRGVVHNLRCSVVMEMRIAWQFGVNVVIIGRICDLFE